MRLALILMRSASAQFLALIFSNAFHQQYDQAESLCWSGFMTMLCIAF
jgi:hypothetical protein